jgi:hypothetical protein
MNNEEIANLFTEALKDKILNTIHYDGRKIIDVKVEINKQSYNDEDGGFDYDELIIKIKTQSPQGKNSKWGTYYL